MQVGNQVSPNSRSVGQRIKEASLKENVQFNNNNNLSNSNGTIHSVSHNLIADALINNSNTSIYVLGFL